MIRDTKFNYCFILYFYIAIYKLSFYTQWGHYINIIILPGLYIDPIVYNLVIMYIKYFFRKSVAGYCFLCLFIIYIIFIYLHCEHSRSRVTKTKLQVGYKDILYFLENKSWLIFLSKVYF